MTTQNHIAIAPTLLALARSGLTGQALPDNERSALDGVRWEEVCELAKRHDLLPLIGAGVAVSGVRPPTDVQAALRKAFYSSELRSDRAWEQMAPLLAAFRERGIGLIALKGAALAARYYRSPGLRPFGDIDLLVQPERRDEAAALLRGLGYANFESQDERTLEWSRGYHYHWSFMPERGFFAELHWRLMPPEAGVSLDYEGLWKRSQTFNSPAGSVGVLSPEDDLIYLSLHIAKHKMAIPLRNLVDIAALLRRSSDLDWEAIARRAEPWGAASSVAATLGTVAHLGLVELPAKAHDYVCAAGPRMDFAKLANYAVHWNEVALPMGLIDIITAGSWKKSAVCLRKTFLPRYETLYGEHLAATRGTPVLQKRSSAYFLRYGAHVSKWARALVRMPRDSQAFWAAVAVRRQIAQPSHPRQTLALPAADASRMETSDALTSPSARPNRRRRD